jgi:hypothetical protein
MAHGDIQIVCVTLEISNNIHAGMFVLIMIIQLVAPSLNLNYATMLSQLPTQKFDDPIVPRYELSLARTSESMIGA